MSDGPRDQGSPDKICPKEGFLFSLTAYHSLTREFSPSLPRTYRWIGPPFPLPRMVKDEVKGLRFYFMYGFLHLLFLHSFCLVTVFIYVCVYVCTCVCVGQVISTNNLSFISLLNF